MITNWVRMRGPVRGTDWGHAGGMRAIHSAIDGIPSHHMMGQRSVKLVCAKRCGRNPLLSYGAVGQLERPT